MFELEGTRVVVTGGGRGLGAAYAQAFLDAGARVAVIDRTLDLSTLPADIDGFEADITDDDALAEAARGIRGRLGGVDVIVNNAAIYMDLGTKRSMNELSLDEWDLIMRVNVRGPWQVTRVMAPAMIAQGHGRIVNVASTTAFGGVDGFVHYATSKAAVVGLTRSLARELGPFGIHVNAIAPGLVDNDASAQLNPDFDRYKERVRAGRALQRNLHASQLVGTVLFLSSAASDMITGQTIVVDGGGVMN